MKTKYIKIAEELEKNGEFTESFTKPNPKKYRIPDKNYVYLPRNPIFFLTSKFFRFILFVFGPFLSFFANHLKIKKSKKVKKVKTGAICICNHVSYFDGALFMRQAHPFKRYYCTVAPTNNKKGFPGYILKSGGAIPFGTQLSVQRNFNKALKKLLEDKKSFVGFLPEQGLWLGYEKPRPMLRGSFHYACIHNVPIIPHFLFFRKPNKFERLFHRKVLITLYIGDPIYPDTTLPINQREQELAKLAKHWYADIYMKLYKTDNINYLNGKSYLDY